LHQINTGSLAETRLQTTLERSGAEKERYWVALTRYIPSFLSRNAQITVDETSAVAGDVHFPGFLSRFSSPLPRIRLAISPSCIDLSLPIHFHPGFLKNNGPLWMESSFYRRRFKYNRLGNITRRSKDMRSILSVVFAEPAVPVRGGLV
jgi:hypothetical protein